MIHLPIPPSAADIVARAMALIADLRADPDADFWTRATRERAIRQKATHQALLSWSAFVVTDSAGRRTLVIVSPEMSDPAEGTHRATLFWTDGPLGHVTRPTVTELARELARDLCAMAIAPMSDDEVTAWCSTPEFIAGAARVAEVQRANEGTSCR